MKVNKTLLKDLSISMLIIEACFFIVSYCVFTYHGNTDALNDLISWNALWIFLTIFGVGWTFGWFLFFNYQDKRRIKKSLKAAIKRMAERKENEEGN